MVIRINDRQGFISPMILVIIIVLEIILGGVGFVFMAELKNERISTQGVQAYYLAEYGCQAMVEKLQTDGDFCSQTTGIKQKAEPDLIVTDVPIENGRYEVYIYGDYDEKHILSVGVINGIKHDFAIWIVRNQQTGNFETEKK